MGLQYNITKVRDRVQELELRLVETLKYSVSFNQMDIELRYKNLVNQGDTPGTLFKTTKDLFDTNNRLIKTVKKLELENVIQHAKDNKFKPKNAKS